MRFSLSVSPAAAAGRFNRNPFACAQVSTELSWHGLDRTVAAISHPAGEAQRHGAYQAVGIHLSNSTNKFAARLLGPVYIAGYGGIHKEANI